MESNNLIKTNSDFIKCFEFCGHWTKEFNLVFGSASAPQRPLEPKDFWKKFNYLSSSEKTKIELIYHLWSPNNPVSFGDIVKLKDRKLMIHLLEHAESGSNPLTQVDKNKDLVRRTIFKLNLDDL